MPRYLAVPDSGSGPGVLVIQEWWGLNPQMKGTADHLAENGFVALAPDLYRGELAGHDEMDKAGHLMTTLPAERAAADMSLAVDALRDHVHDGEHDRGNRLLHGRDAQPARRCAPR